MGIARATWLNISGGVIIPAIIKFITIAMRLFFLKDSWDIIPIIDKITNIIEKPKPKDAPSNLAVMGRYILSPNIFKYLESAQQNFDKNVDKEIQLTPAIAALIKQEHVYALHVNGVRYDCGQKIGYLQAMVKMALKHPTIKDEFKKFLNSL